MFKKVGFIFTASLMASPVMANTYMDAGWAKQACNAWNKSSTLTELLVDVDAHEDVGGGYSWIKNDAKRGYKLVQMYRSKCGDASKIQLMIQKKGDKAMCVAAGKPDGKKMNYAVDYVMHATDNNWACMGRGSFGCGAMGAMMSGKLKFKGPKVEAMKVMSPFEAFLKVAGSLPGDKASCPK
jgi:putative sterol carrier protein